MKVVFLYKEGLGLGVGYLSSYIKKHGHEVDLVYEHNTFANMYINVPGLQKIEKALDDSLRTLQAKEYDIVAFSVSTADYPWALDLARKIKAYRNIPIIFGGYHPTLLPELCIQNKEIDMICLGEGEEAFLELLDSMERGAIDYSIRNIWFKKDGKVIRNELRPLKENIDDLPFPDRDLFFQFFPDFWKREIGFVLASRGCPFRCSYCGNAAFNELYRGKGKILRLRNTDNVLEECLFLRSKYGVKKIHFQDDLFASNTAWLEDFIPKYKKQVKVPFTCLTHPKVMSLRNIELLKEGRCLLAIVGIQSGSERVRREIFKRNETNQEIAQFAENCHKVKLNFSFNHIFDAPTDNEPEIFESARFYNQVRPRIIDSYVLVYFPRASIIQTALETKILKQEDVAAINEGMFEGVHQGGFYHIFGKYYQQYALLFVLIPALPRKLVDKILNTPWMLRVVKRLPLLFMPFVKTYLNFLCGSSSFHYAAIRFSLYRMRKVLMSYWKIRKQLKALVA